MSGIDTTFNQNFLMTFKSFMTVDELFDLLARRFWIAPPPNLSQSELEEWAKWKQNIIRVRCVSPVLGLESYPYHRTEC